MRFLLLLPLCGCLGAPFTPAATCREQGMTIYLERLDKCAPYEELAQDAVTTVAPFSTGPWSVEVWVHEDTNQIICDGETGGIGCYVRGAGRIELNRSGAGLAHELLHHVEYQEGVTGADALAHVGWTERGASSDEVVDYPGHPALLGSWYDATEQFLYRHY